MHDYKWKKKDFEYVYVLNAVDHFIFKIYLEDDKYILGIQFLKKIILGRKWDYYCVSKSDDHRFSILIVSHCASYISPTADHYLYVKVKMRNFFNKFKLST